MQCGLNDAALQELSAMLLDYMIRYRALIKPVTDIRTRRLLTGELNIKLLQQVKTRFGACAMKNLYSLLHPTPTFPRPVIQKIIRQRRTIKTVI